MAMVQTKIVLASAAVAALCSCATPRLSWEKTIVAGRLTGVTAELTGTVDSVYHAPNGNPFAAGTATYKVAEVITDMHPKLVSMTSEVIGYCPEGMVRNHPECDLYDWAADMLAEIVSRHLDKKVDMAFMNSGGIRIDMPKGDVKIEDMLSMFPFHNSPVYVSMKGSDILKLFDRLAANKFEALSGVEIRVAGGKVVSAMIGGRPVDPESYYGVATIDFVLDGGDGYFLANNARECISASGDIKDYIISLMREKHSKGEPVEVKVRERIKISEEGK